MEEDALKALIVRAIDGDEVALKVVLTRTRRDLHDYVTKRIPRSCRHLFDADDIVQVAHMSIFQNIAQMRSTHAGSFHRWTRAIALNRLRNAINACRTAKRQAPQRQPGDRVQSYEDSTIALFSRISISNETASKALARAEAISMMETAMAELPHHYRQALLLVHLEGFGVKETAIVLGRTDRAIHGLCRRALRQLEAHLGSVSKYLSSST
jgi:RNA polymerase sigma-70 factor, ECF subfamily